MRIQQEAIDAIVADARDALPNECCGLLIGSAARIDRAHRSRNLHASPTRFLIDPEDHFAAIRAAREAGLEVIGIYHSHPAHAAMPSAADLAEASYAEYVYLIVSLAVEPADVRLFRLESGEFVEAPLQVST